MISARKFASKDYLHPSETHDLVLHPHVASYLAVPTVEEACTAKSTIFCLIPSTQIWSQIT